MTNILIVDDEVSIQRMLSYILRNSEFTPFVAGNAEEALEQLKKQAMDLLLLDVAMPDTDGITFLRHLREMPEYLELPVIMLTASTSERHRVEAQNAGVAAYLNKLASPDELLQIIRNVLDKS
ncbi:MAG TPA: response regulator [Anaerolineae bacterium]|nr:response regulator [Anaerolineae bacterium]